MKDKDSTKSLTSDPTAELDSPERRAALEKLAVLSAWTAPAMLTLLRSKRASANSLPPGTPGSES